MSEPDEALIWAREYWAARFEEDTHPKVASDYRSGRCDIHIKSEAEAYRAGQAASAERIKALERLLREIKPVAHLFQWNDLRDQIEALLKEADQVTGPALGGDPE